MLDEIPGVGPKRRKALQTTFSSIAEIRQASMEELAAVPGIPMKAAREIWGYFHEDEKMEGKKQ